MREAERKALSYLVRHECDMYAATMGSKPIWENREHMREFIGQGVDAQVALWDVPGALAEWLIAAREASDDRRA